MAIEETEAYRAYLALIDQLEGEGLHLETRKMFGMPCVAIDGRLVGGFYQDCLVVKLDGHRLEAALAVPGAVNFDPMHGRPMKRWVQIPYAAHERWRDLLADAARNPVA